METLNGKVLEGMVNGSRLKLSRDTDMIHSHLGCTRKHVL
jgi:hypothetical protein